MELSLDTLLAYLAESLPARDRTAVDQALVASPTLRGHLAALRRAVETVQDDARWLVPSGATAAAKELGARLDALRPASIGERARDAIRALVASLTFDGRVEGSLAGMRGDAGFAMSYRCAGGEIDLECNVIDDGTCRILGQLRCEGGARYASIDALGDDARVISHADLDTDGMFSLELPAGIYVLRFQADDPSLPTIEVPDVDVP